MLIDLNNIVQSTLAKFGSEGKISEMVEKNLNITVNNVVSRLFDYRSDIRNTLE
jgi:antitoxin component HigA of HigAB toxin-antitoxin module